MKKKLRRLPALSIHSLFSLLEFSILTVSLRSKAMWLTQKRPLTQVHPLTQVRPLTQEIASLMQWMSLSYPEMAEANRWMSRYEWRWCGNDSTRSWFEFSRQKLSVRLKREVWLMATMSLQTSFPDRLWLEPPSARLRCWCRWKARWTWNHWIREWSHRHFGFRCLEKRWWDKGLNLVRIKQREQWCSLRRSTAHLRFFTT